MNIFRNAFFVNFGPKMGSNASPAQARERQKIEKKLVRLLRRSFLVLGGASGRVFCRFCIKFETEIIGFASNSTRNLYVFSDRFSITFVIGNAAIGCFRCYVCALPWHKIWNRNQICARWLQEFLGIKSALTRITHPQHPFSKGGGLAKRPQFAVPQRGAGVVLNGSVKSPVPEGLPFLTFPAASARPPTLSV